MQFGFESLTLNHIEGFGKVKHKVNQARVWKPNTAEVGCTSKQITKSLAVLTIWSKIFLMILELKLCKYTLNYAPTQQAGIKSIFCRQRSVPCSFLNTRQMLAY